MPPRANDIGGFAHTTLMLREKLSRLDESFPCKTGEAHCTPCESAENCRKMMDHFCEELLDFMQERFLIEDDAIHLLRRMHPDRDSFADHQKDHDKLMRQLVSLIGSNQPPSALRSAFRHIVTTWLHEHAPAHDFVLIETLKRA